MSNTIVPVAGEPHLAQDLIEYLVATMLKSDSSANFINGIPSNSATEDLTKIYLVPYYLEDKPANCGVVRVSDISAEHEDPIRRAQVTIVLRQKGDSTFSTQARSMAAAEAVLQFLRPEGQVRTYATLPSGRVVLSFFNAATRPEGEDGSGRFLAAVEFTVLYRDINVP